MILATLLCLQLVQHTCIGQLQPEVLQQRFSAGGAFSLLVRPDGTVQSVGYNISGQLGNGSYVDSRVLTDVQGLTNVSAVSAGYYHALALTTSGDVYAWGQNDSSQLGYVGGNSNLPLPLASLSNMVAIATGQFHSLALKGDGTVWAWGRNSDGQLGDGTYTTPVAPVQVSGLYDIVAIGCGYYHSMAIRADGAVWTWGRNSNGQMGQPLSLTKSNVPVELTTIDSVVAIYGGISHTVALKGDGTVWTWGANGSGQLGDGSVTNRYMPDQVHIIGDIVSVSAGQLGNVAVKSDGSVWTWGTATYGALGIGPPPSAVTKLEPVEVPDLSGVLTAVAGYHHMLAVKSDGNVWAWGYDYFGQSGTHHLRSVSTPVQISNLNSIRKIVAGYTETLALDSDGKLWKWGVTTNATPLAGVPTEILGIDGVSDVDNSAISGVRHAIAVRDGNVWTWGGNGRGQLGNGTTIASAFPIQVAGLSGATKVAAGGGHSLAVVNGTVYSWGANYSGQLGDTTTTGSLIPISTGLQNVVEVAAAQSMSAAVKHDGSVWVWGGNSDGVLGNTVDSYSAAPLRIQLEEHVKSVATDGTHVLALTTDGHVWAWGKNSRGQLGNGSTVSSATPVKVNDIDKVVAIATEGPRSFAVDESGAVWYWGADSTGIVTNAVPTKNVAFTGAREITAGPGFVTVVKFDGTLAAVGSCSNGEIAEGLAHPNEQYSPQRFLDVNMMFEMPQVASLDQAEGLSGQIGVSKQYQFVFDSSTGVPETVKYYHYGIEVGEDNSAPFTLDFTPNTWGNFPIVAIGRDSSGVYSQRSLPAVVNVPSDSDNDGLPDWWEHKHHNTLSHGATDDLDNDGLTEAGEHFHGTSPTDGDTDDDASPDGAEFAAQYGLIPTSVAVAESKANVISLTWQCSYPYETSFLIEKSEDGNTWTIAGSAPANATSYAVTGLVEKTAYQFQVTTVSLYGNGKSAPVSGATKPAKPLSPSQLAVVTSSGAEVTLSWVDGSGNETGFVVEGKEDGASSFQVLATASANATLATVSGLTGTSAYMFRVKSVNSDGTDTESSGASQELSLPALPTPPASLTLLSELWNQCRLEWSLPSDSTRSGVKVFGFDSSGTIERFRINLDKDSEEFTDTGLVAATGYQYQVASVNLRGESVVSLQSVTTGAHVPLPATGLVLTPMGPRSMKVEWTDNANNETSYVVERATTSGASTWLPSPVLPANTVAYLDNVGLQGAGAYYYRVRAINENGSSVSAEATGTTASYSGSNHAPDVLGVLQDLTMNGMSAVTTQVPLPYSTGYIEGAKDGEFLFAPKSGGGGSTLYVSRVIAPVGSPPVDTLRVEYFTGSGWALAGNLTTPASSSGYGTSVAVSGNRLYVGAPGANDANGVASGMVYVVEFSVNASNQLVVAPPSRLAGVVGAAGDQFGASLAIDGSRLIVGAPGKDKPSSGGAIVDAGAVQLYDWSGSAWVHNRTEYSPTAMAGDQFGFSVSLRARNYVVGAPYEDLPLTASYTLQDSGAIYLGRWDNVATLRWLPNLFVLEPAVASKVTGLNQSHFGFSVAIDSYMRVAVGRPDSTWQVSDNMSDWDRGNVMLLQWNGELGDEYVILRRSIVAGGLSAGSRFGEYVEESQGYDFAIRTALRDVSNRPGVFYTVLAMAARPGQLVGSVETSRRVGTAIGLDEDHDPLTFSIPTASNPLSSHFEFGADRVLRAKSTLGTVADGFYTLYATVADDRGGSLTKPLLLYVLGVEDANDADRDGIPDAWELANGLDSNSVFDALSDLDGDGYSALEEYQRFLSGQTSGVDPRSWDLDPDGDIDGDSIVNRLDADPRNPAVGSLGIEITAPVNLQTL